jgi:tripartite ATP-independent transporter DctM subunit
MSAAELVCLALFAAVIGLLMSGFPVAFVLAGTSLAFALGGAAFGLFDTALLAAFPQRVFATMSGEIWIAIPLFILMGVLLERSRVAEDLLDTLGRLFARVPGGLAVSVCVVGALMAASTGIVGATVVTMGLLSLPTMLKRGYSARFACGSIAACGTLGQLIPPSIVLVLLGDQIANAFQKAQIERGIIAPDSVSVNDLFAGALLPGLVLVGLYMAYQVAYALLRPGAAPPVRAADPDAPPRPLAGAVVRTLLGPIGLIVAVLGSILAGLASPSEAASLGAAGALVLAGLRQPKARRGAIALGTAALVTVLVLAGFFDVRLDAERGPTWAFVAAVLACLAGGWGLWQALRATLRPVTGGEDVLRAAMRSTLRVSAMIFAVVIGASLFSLVFRGFGGDRMVERLLGELPGGTVAAILVVLAAMFVMGFVLDFLEIMLIVVPVAAPVLLQMQAGGGATVDPIWLGVMMALVLQTSFLTPPFGFALFYLRGVAPHSVRTVDIYAGAAPFVALQLAAVAILWSAPAVATWLPYSLYSR